MNCCDHYGRCGRGRDCQARETRASEADEFEKDIQGVCMTMTAAALLAFVGGLVCGLLWGWLA